MTHQPPTPQSSSEAVPGPSPEDLGLGPLFRHSRDAVVVGGQDGRILAWNPAAEQLYGYTAEEVVGQPFDRLIPEHNMAEVQALMETYTPGPLGSVPGSSAPIEMPATHKSGAEIFVEFSVSVFQVAGESYGFATIRDCTERKRLEAERDTLLANAQDTVRRAEELAAIKADLSAMISHELGSPLAAIGAMIDLLERDELPPAKRTQILATMRTETHLLQRLVEDIRSATSMERGEFAVHPEPVEIATLFADAGMSAGQDLEHHDFGLDPYPQVQVLADRERVSQILRNLIKNAAKYTPRGTKVRLGATKEDERVRIYVCDEGPGIHPDDLERIFSKFGRGRDATGKQIPGMGLGLFLSQQIARGHGGQLAATSEPGKGSTFSFDLQEAS